MINEPKAVSSANTVQDIVSDNLFPHVEHISDVKQVLELSRDLGLSIKEPQIRAILYLEHLGSNKLLHPNGSPYKHIVTDILNKYKVAAVDQKYFLDMVMELIPKPPKPVVVTPNGKAIQVGGR